MSSIVRRRRRPSSSLSVVVVVRRPSSVPIEFPRKYISYIAAGMCNLRQEFLLITSVNDASVVYTDY